MCEIYSQPILKDVRYDVEVEPHLQTLTGEVLSNRANPSDEARLNASARSFWQKGEKAFFDVRAFNSCAKSHLNQKLYTTFSSNENEKKRQYNQQVIEIEHGSFSPLVFSPYNGTGREADRFRASSEACREKEHTLEYHYSLVESQIIF